MHKALAASAALLIAVQLPVFSAEPPVQQLSLDDCIRLALEHNLDLQIERRNPIRASYDIDAAIGGYFDPSLSVRGQHDFQKSGLRTDADNRLVPGSESDTDSFSAGFSGILPTWGTRYSISASANESEGSRDFIGTNNLVAGQIPFQSSRGSASITVTQPLLRNFWMDSGRLNIESSKNNLRIAELVLKRRVMDVITQVETAYYNLIYTYESVQVQEMALQLAKRSLDETKKRFEVGTVAELETKQTEAQVAAREADVLTARRNLDIQQNVIKRLISDNYAEVHRLVLQPQEKLTAALQALDVELSWDRGLSDRPDLAQSRIDLENIGLQLKYDRNQLWPQLDLQGSYGQSGSGVAYNDSFERVTRGDEPFWSVGGVINIPIGNRAARSRYRSNKLREEQLLLSYKGQEQGIMIEIDNAIKQAASSYDRVQATRKASEYSLAALEAEQKKLENGKSTSFVVLQLQNDLTSARSSELRAVADYNNALAELSFREASTLDRHGINWELQLEQSQRK